MRSEWHDIDSDGATLDLDTDYPGVCELHLNVWDSGAGAALEIELWNDSLCNGVTGYGKVLCVYDYDGNTITLDPDTGDGIYVDGDIQATGDPAVSSGTAGDSLCIVGSFGGATGYWSQRSISTTAAFTVP